MGHKVHPNGFRLGVSRTWNAKWYSDKDYTSLLKEDMTIRRLVQRRLANASVSLVEIERGTLTKVDASGRTSVVATPGGGPNGAAIGPDGACYITNNGGFEWVKGPDGIRPHMQAHDYTGGRIERVDLTTGKVDVLYTNDSLNRLVRAEEGSLSGGSISSRTRDQQWTLDQVGNWEEDKLDLNGDGDWSDTDEWDDCRTHNDVNELTGRDLDCTPGTSGDNYTLAYDEAGNLTDDATDYKYEWDAFYRLRKVRNQSDALVAEYKYNGRNCRVTPTWSPPPGAATLAA